MTSTTATRVLTRATVVAVCEQHGIATRVVDTTAGPILEAWESATRVVDGAVLDVSAWIVAPLTRDALAAWLGY